MQIFDHVMVHKLLYTSIRKFYVSSENILLNVENRLIKLTYIFYRIREPLWCKLAVRENRDSVCFA